jgi:hypothetical protein
MTTFPASGGKPPLLGQVALPLAGGLVVLWQLLFDIAAAVPIGRWQLVGGQMVLLHGLCAGRQPLRATHDIDVLADLLTASDGLRVVVAAIEGLGFEPVEDSSGHIYRFARSQDNAAVDVLAPDHTPPRWRIITAQGNETIRVDGGRQAMQRPALIGVTMADTTAEIPVPDLLGALVLKAAAWMVDGRWPGTAQRRCRVLGQSHRRPTAGARPVHRQRPQAAQQTGLRLGGSRGARMGLPRRSRAGCIHQLETSSLIGTAARHARTPAGPRHVGLTATLGLPAGDRNALAETRSFGRCVGGYAGPTPAPLVSRHRGCTRPRLVVGGSGMWLLRRRRCPVALE